MKRLNLGNVALVIGALLLFLSVAADIVRPGGAPGFGTLQLALAVFCYSGARLRALGEGVIELRMVGRLEIRKREL